MNTELYFNGQKAYFDKEEVIVGSYALNKAGDLKSRQGIATNTYSLPFVKQNKEIFADCELIQNEGTGPYVQYEHEVLIEGVSVFKGSAFVIESWGVYKVQAVAGNSDFYLLLKDKSLSDLDFSDLDHIRNDTNIIASWANTEGYIYPFVDYGKYQTVADSSVGSDESLNIVSPSDLYPALFLKTVIQKIADETEYIFQGDVFALARFNEEIIPFTNFPFIGPDQGKFEGNATMTELPGSPVLMVLLNVVTDPSSNYDSFGFYTVGVAAITIKISLTITNISSNVFVQVVKRNSFTITNDPNPTSDDEIILSSQGSKKVEKEISLNPGERIFVISFNNGLVSHQMVINSFTIETVEINQGYNLLWKFASNVPDIKLDKFILDFMNRYGLSIITDNDNKIITFNFDDDILLNEQIDWSGKIDYSNKNQTDLQDVFYRLPNYTQNNKLTYATSDFLPDGFDYTFTIDDEYLNTEIYEDFISEFALAPPGSAFLGAIQTINLNMMKIKEGFSFKGVYTSDVYAINDVVFYHNGTFKAIVANPIAPPVPANATGKDTSEWATVKENDIWDIQDGIPIISRISRQPEGPTVDFQDEFPQEIKVFAVNTDMDWTSIWNNHYQALKRILVKTKVIQLPMLLNYSDIAQLDLTRPVWIRELGLHFKVDEVIQFKYNQVDSTLVRLIRL